MYSKATTLVCGVVLIFVLTSIYLPAQDSGTVSGTVTDPAGKPVPNAKVSIKNATTGPLSEAQTDSAGHYTFSNLAAGDYQVLCSVEAAGQISAKVTVATGAEQNLNLSLTANPAAPADSLPNAPSSGKTEPALEDLGFSKSEQQGNARQQALLDKRTHMLKIPQRVGPDHDHPDDCIRCYVAECGRQKRGVSSPRSARSAGGANRRFVRNYRVLREFARRRSRAPRRAAPSRCIRFWPGSTAPAWCLRRFWGPWRSAKRTTEKRFTASPRRTALWRS